MENKFNKYPKLLEQMANDIMVFYRREMDKPAQVYNQKYYSTQWKRSKLLESNSKVEKWEYEFKKTLEFYIETDRITYGKSIQTYYDDRTGKDKDYENSERIWFIDYGMNTISKFDEPKFTEAFAPFIKKQLIIIHPDIIPKNILINVKGNICEIFYKRIKVVSEPKVQQTQKPQLKDW